MSKQPIDPFDYLPQFMKILAQPGALLTSVNNLGRPNVMTIGWAHLGILWGKPVCLIYVRPSRYTFTCLQQVRQFTVNLPTPDLAPAVALCGSCSGRDTDKFSQARLPLLPAQTVKPPAVESCILHYECGIVHYNDLIPQNLESGIIGTYFPQQDFHRVYFGQVLACYGKPSALNRL